MRKKYILSILFACVAMHSIAQNKTSSSKTILDGINATKSEELNSKLTSYMRVVADNITSDNSGYTFKMSLIALKDSSKWISGNDFCSPHIRFLRYTEVNAGVGLDKQQNVTNINLGGVFTLLNRRDTAVYVYMDKNRVNMAQKIAVVSSRNYINLLMQNGKSSDEALKLTGDELNKVDITGGKINGTISDDFREILDKVTDSLTGKKTIEGLKGFFDNWDNDFVLYAKSVARKPLWTVYPKVSYDYKNGSFSKLGFGSDFYVGLTRNPKRKAWEFVANASYYDQNDTSTTKFGLNQSIITTSLGINKILMENQKGESQMELKFDGEYSYLFKAPGDQIKFTADVVFKYKLFQSVWLPLKLSYDPKNGNLLGFISVTVNFMPSSK